MMANTLDCPCSQCQVSSDGADPHHLRLRAFFAALNERQRRAMAGVEALRLGYGGTRLVSQILELDEKTVLRGRRDVLAGHLASEQTRVRKPGAGRKRSEKKSPVSSTD
jgi:hypothetical protein